MHEIGIVQSALSTALQSAVTSGAQRVERIKLRVGEESGVDPDVISFVFPLTARGTIAEGAQLEIESVAVRCRCPQCAIEFAPDDTLHACPHCGRVGAGLIAGHEFYVAAIDIT